ncbi:unnamed protein product [Cyclocybe aegerita]|uniref:Carboxylic ester hydrolase n=1 Tax=Cyclocybe aegerita TaxID=1973307 RepID=A0A8S0W428_CYCAE|nr:unnamed protein product [Cyclocybe aegerita]
MLSRFLIALAFQAAFFTTAAPAGAPIISLDGGTFTGVAVGSTERFLGIPFAKPPVGNLRYRLPQANAPYQGSYDATSFGPSCPQKSTGIPVLIGLTSQAAEVVDSVYKKISPDAEDCLTLNVIKPASTTPTSKLPVLIWIFGGGFDSGSPTIYDGTTIVARSITLGTPVIYVSMNYRLAGFGFLPGKEVKAAGVGNLGLQDQRQAFRWVQKYITQFGGDPTKVTIWGESAGAISVSLHMVANGGNTEGLFRAAFMQSGAPIPVGDIANGQESYDTLVSDTGCSDASDTLACLRTVPYGALKAAIDKSPRLFDYQPLRLSWLPRTDGVFLTDNPQRLVQQGKVAKIPYVTGNCDDEGTLFSLSSLNVTTESQLKSYAKTIFLPGATNEEIEQLATLYPGDITEGSPFDTGVLNAITPQIKRIAAFQGDGIFQAPRRWMLQNTLPSNPNVWVFLSKRMKFLPVLGSVHASDIPNVLDPNGKSGFQWPKYTLGSRQLLTFLDGFIPLTITSDTYREASMNYLTNITLTYPV